LYVKNDEADLHRRRLSIVGGPMKQPELEIPVAKVPSAFSCQTRPTIKIKTQKVGAKERPEPA
jgi:hypothetical protein